MDRVNALLIEKLERLHAECVGARPGHGGARRPSRGRDQRAAFSRSRGL